MPRTCTICEHPNRDEIDHLIINGNTFRHIASQYNFSYRAVKRHKDNHLNKKLAKAKEVQEVVHANSLLGQVRDLQMRALNILDAAEGSGDLRTALTAIKETRGCLELLGKLAGELQAGQVVNVLVSPQWVTLRSVILESLEPFPEARLAVASALEGVDNGSS